MVEIGWILFGAVLLRLYQIGYRKWDAWQWRRASDRINRRMGVK